MVAFPAADFVTEWCCNGDMLSVLEEVRGRGITVIHIDGRRRVTLFARRGTARVA